MIQNGRKRIHTTHPDGRELIEEYDIKTDDLVVRRHRSKTALGAYTEWTYEVGEAPAVADPTSTAGTGLLIAESRTSPVVVRRDTKSHFVFRVRNVPWPRETYQVSVDVADRRITVRTTNKKYYTRISIPDMDRLGLPFNPASMAFDWGSNTLVIMYQKPQAVLDIEKAEREERRGMASSNDGVAKDGDVQCNPS
ncbi:DPCD protein family-domain-containing protein [Entophlyctis helioformis]|nr:DPCD protein family-domain-containing protein [Entophlyctis helioformis]